MRERTTQLELVVLAAVCAFVFFYGLAHFGLVGADEPRYAQIAREMLERHDWVTPTLYGKPWLEKPVLYYWSAIVSYRIFGVSDWAARLPTAVFASAMVFATYTFVRRFRPGTQLNAALVVATSAGVIGFARAASTDMPLTATFAMAMLSWSAWQQTGAKRWLSIFYVALALATLAKGPVAPFLAAAIVVPYAALRRDWRVVVRSLWPPGLVIYVAFVLPWYVAVERSTHQFFRVFILEHNLARYGTNVFQHHQPFWYYLLVLPVALLPWTVFSVAGFLRTARDRRDDISLLLAVWAAVPVIFFSFSGSKLPGYILPALPAWALLATWWQPGRAATKLAVAHTAVVALVFGGALLSSYAVLNLRPPPAAWMIAAVGGVAVFAAGIFSLRAFGWRALRLATIVPLVIALGFVLRFVAPSIDMKQSARPVAETLARRRSEGMPIVIAGVRRELVYGLGFYRNEPVLVPASELPSAVDMVRITSVPERGFIYIVRAGSSASVPPSRTAAITGGYAPQGLRFIYVPATDVRH
jgi:4-amino-4-deoxy-L-arabinose transferase-like glycosyltransferase